jgi:hypothetical protein
MINKLITDNTNIYLVYRVDVTYIEREREREREREIHWRKIYNLFARALETDRKASL